MEYGSIDDSVREKILPKNITAAKNSSRATVSQ